MASVPLCINNTISTRPVSKISLSLANNERFGKNVIRDPDRLSNQPPGQDTNINN